MEPGYAASYLDFLGGYFRDFRDLTGYFGSFTPGHLWFILFLFVISCSALPLALVWRGDAGRRWRGRVSGWVGRPGAILLLALPLAAMRLLPEAGGKNPFFYWLLFIYGYVFMSEAAWQRAVDRHRRVALAAAAVTSAGLMVIWGSRPGWASSGIGDLLVGLMETVNGWAWVIALVGLAHAHLDVAHPALRCANEAAYPFYILHQTVLVAVGWWMVRWPVGVALKWALICVAGGGLTLAAYEVLVRRSRLMRFLFGMKPAAPGVGGCGVGGRGDRPEGSRGLRPGAEAS